MAATVFALFVLALPAAATESVETVAAGGFGTGQWDGLMLVAVAGLLLGLAVFFDADPGGLSKANEHHDDH